MSNTLVIMPTYIRDLSDLKIVEKALKTFRASTDARLLAIDDGSPATPDLMEWLETCLFDIGNCSLIRKEVSSGFANTVNLGLRMARDEGMHALVVHDDIEFIQKGYIERMEAREEAVVGALLLYPNGFIQTAGIFFSVIRREFDHIYRMAPKDLPAAQEERICPVSSAFQFIRNSTLKEIGIYDENFRMGYEDIDYCQRVFQAEGLCVYDPHIVAVHREPLNRKLPPELRKHEESSWRYMHEKWAGHDFSAYMPTLIEEIDEL